MLMKNMLSCEKSRISLSVAVGGCRKQSAGLKARRCDVGLTSTWFVAALLDVSGSSDLPDISMNVTKCHYSFFHLQCQHSGASTCISEAW